MIACRGQSDAERERNRYLERPDRRCFVNQRLKAAVFIEHCRSMGLAVIDVFSSILAECPADATQHRSEASRLKILTNNAACAAAAHLN